jgi:hypothetical protein
MVFGYIRHPFLFELNELDWKQNLSPNTYKVAERILLLQIILDEGYIVFSFNGRNAQPMGVYNILTKNAQLLQYRRKRIELFHIFALKNIRIWQTAILF